MLLWPAPGKAENRKAARQVTAKYLLKFNNPGIRLEKRGFGFFILPATEGLVLH
jgi:hypothetical protein